MVNVDGPLPVGVPLIAPLAPFSDKARRQRARRHRVV